jgi:hypothetical protein
MRSKKVPRLTRLLRKVKRLSDAEQNRVRAAMAEAEAEWARIDARAAARAKKEASDG